MENIFREVNNPLAITILVVFGGIYIAYSIVFIVGVFRTRKATFQQAYRMHHEKDHKRLIIVLMVGNVVLVILFFTGQIPLPLGLRVLVIVLTDLLFLPYIVGMYVFTFLAGKRMKELEQRDHHR